MLSLLEPEADGPKLNEWLILAVLGVSVNVIDEYLGVVGVALSLVKAASFKATTISYIPFVLSMRD